MYRISKKPRGWIVEKQEFKFRFLGLYFYKVWRPFVKSSGMDSCWHHKTRDFALMNLHDEINNSQIKKLYDNI